MRYPLFLLCFLIFGGLSAQSITGRVINKETREPLAYAEIQTGNEQVLTNIDGSFKFNLNKQRDSIRVSYVGYRTIQLQISSDTKYLQIALSPDLQQLETILISNKTDPAVLLIKKPSKTAIKMIQNRYCLVSGIVLILNLS